MIPLITLEEHFFAADVPDTVSSRYAEQFKHLPHVKAQLYDLDTLRLASMDASSISIQVISHGPGLALAPAEYSQRANAQLAAAVAQHPTRFRAFAVLPMHDPVAAAAELRRCITQETGFVGALIDNHVHGKHYEGQAYLPFWSAVQELDVPIYLHPTWPAPAVQQPPYVGEIPAAATLSLGSSAWGWHSDVSVHVLKLFAAGVFDAFPRLKIVVGHMGEMLPFMLERIEQLSPRWAGRERKFGQVWRENIWITTSGNWSVNPLATILRNTPLDHILYSVDYPFAKNEDGLAFMQDLEKSGLVTKEQLDMIGYKNSEQLLRVKVKQ